MRRSFDPILAFTCRSQRLTHCFQPLQFLLLINCFVQLTDLPNRTLITDRLRQTFIKVKRDKVRMALTSDQDVMVVAEKITKALTCTFRLGEHSLHISVSIGIAIYPDHGDDDKTLIKNADFAMYHAKRSGSNCVEFYQTDMQEMS